MTVQRMIELLEIEHECMLRGSHDDCDRNCADCELVQDDSDLHEMYTDVISLLKEREAVEPRRDANHVRMFRCGACGEYVGFIDSNPGDPNEQDNYCRNCGRKVKWDA